MKYFTLLIQKYQKSKKYQIRKILGISNLNAYKFKPSVNMRKTLTEINKHLII